MSVANQVQRRLLWVLVTFVVLSCSAARRGDEPRRDDELYEKARVVVYRYLSEMHQAWKQKLPEREQELEQELKATLANYGPEGLEAVASYLHGSGLPVEVEPFSPCTAAYALSFAGQDDPGRVVSLVTSAMPLKEHSEDICAAGAMIDLGPPAYPHVIECARTKTTNVAYWCMIALLAQSEELPDAIEAMGLTGADGEMQEPPTDRRRIRAVVERWAAWWEKRKDELRRNPETNLLEEQ